MNGHIRKRKNVTGTTWQIIITLGENEQGKRQRIYKTVKGTKKEAQKIMTKMMNDLNSDTYIQPTKITLAQYLREWLETYVEPNLSPTSIAGYKVNIFNHIIPSIGSVQLQQLKPIQIQHMYDALANPPANSKKKALSAKTIRYIHVNLREALQHAVKMQLIAKNPADFVTIPKVKKYRAEVYNEEEVIKLLNAAQGTDMEVPICLAVGLGLRRGELLGLHWSAIDFEKKQVTIKSNLVYVNKQYIFREPKTESGARVISIPDGLLKILRKHRIKQKETKLRIGSLYQDMDLVCCREDGSPINPGAFSHKFARFLKKHQLKKVRFHDLRHTNASLMLKYGIPAKVASSRLGHSNIGITLDLYSHIYADVENEASEKINEGIFGKANLG